MNLKNLSQSAEKCIAAAKNATVLFAKAFIIATHTGKKIMFYYGNEKE